MPADPKGHGFVSVPVQEGFMPTEQPGWALTAELWGPGHRRSCCTERAAHTETGGEPVATTEQTRAVRQAQHGHRTTNT